MKGFLVVDRLNDIHFIDTDKEFAKHINDEAKEMGFIGDDVSDMTKIDPNIVMQQFSPLFMSQWFMIDHANNPCSSISTDNFLFVFRQFEDFLIIAINGDGTECEDFLCRKTLVFVRLIGFTMGPVSEEIGKPKFVSKTERWNFLRLLISTWTYLAKNEQSFLVEAVEKLHMNLSMNVSEKCVDTLQHAIGKLRDVGERHAQHALLLVNSKLLALYSNRNAPELLSPDILCIILLVRSLFPTHDRIEDLFAQTYNASTNTSTSRQDAQTPATIRVSVPHRERYESAVEGFTTGDETENDEYFSAFEGKHWDDSSPPLPGTAERSSDSGSEKPAYPAVSESYVTPTTSPTSAGENMSSSHKESFRPKVPDLKRTLDMFRNMKSRISVLTDKTSLVRQRSHTLDEINNEIDDNEAADDAMGRGRSRSFGEVNLKERHLCSHRSGSDLRLHETEDEDEAVFNAPHDLDYVKQPAFLYTPLCKYSPYQMHCRKIFPGIILIVLTESTKLSQANKLVQLFQLLKELLREHKEPMNALQGQFMYETINTQLAKLLLSLRKARVSSEELTEGHLESVCLSIKKKWETEDVRGALLSYLEQSSSTDLSPSLERSLKFLLNKLTEIFLILYLSPRPSTQEVLDTLDSVRDLFVDQLKDWKEFLIVKAQRNITMTTYITEFPGLVHFIYVNRRTNQIVAPSINVTQNTKDSSSLDATQLLKDKIWSMMTWMHQKLHEGHMTVMARDGDYFFSYFFWFENTSGVPEVIQKPYRADCTAPPPGVLTGNFYKYVTHKCFPNVVRNTVHGKELFMMHVGLANSHYVANHCRQLAAKLNAMSGDMLSNISVFAT